MARTIAVDTVSEAAVAAAVAARASGLAVRELRDLEHLRLAVDLIGDIWGRDAGEPVVSLDLVRALSHSGGFVGGAFDGEELVGATVGFRGAHDGRTSLHSHVTGVLPRVRSRRVGFALKQLQRAWSLEHGIGVITWTFDPLVSRNAYFNIARLGAFPAAYERNFYGAMADDLNRGDESDRLLVAWDLTSPAAVRAATGEPLIPGDVPLDATVALRADDEGWPVTAAPEGPVVVCCIPEDIVAIRRRDLSCALAWRMALRATLAEPIRDGYSVAGFARDGRYILEA